MTVAPRPHPFGLSPVLHAARPCWRLAVQQGTALVAQHGGQVLSWLPTGGKEVLWLSPKALPPPDGGLKDEPRTVARVSQRKKIVI